MKLFWFLALAPVAGLAQVSFTKLTLDPVMQSTATTPAAFADFNRDGWIDLYLGVYSGQGFAFTNNGDGSFTRITNSAVSVGAPNYGAAWGDFDNDGWPDLLVGVNSGGNDIVVRNVAGAFTRLTTQQFAALAGYANNVAWVDYDNDGLLDAYVANSDQNDFVFHNEGNGSFARVLTNAIAMEPGNSQGAAWGDYDDDGLPDLVVSRVNTLTLLFRNLGGGAFQKVTDNVIAQTTGVSQGITWVDYDNDGRLDLFVANPNNFNWLFHNDGAGQFSRGTNALVSDAGNHLGCAWADYDNDGWLDVFVAINGAQGQFYHNEGGTFTRITNSLPAIDSGSAFAGAWGDINNDGFQDLVVTHYRNQTTFLYRNDGNTNHWLTVELEGLISNRSAIGAKVRVEATIKGTKLRQLRQISGGDGLGSQNDPRACFGLGDAERVETLLIEWPSGVRQTLRDVAANQILHIVEQVDGPVVFLRQPESLLLRPGSNGIFQATVTGTTPVTYQWFKDDAPIRGATNLSLAVTNAQLADEGAYTLTASNSFGVFTSSNAAVVILIRPTITIQPVSQSVVAGGSVTLSVSATGHPLPISFRWRRGGTTLTNVFLYDTNSFFTVANITNQASYNVAITNLAGSAFVSSNAVITVLQDTDGNGLPDEWETTYGVTSPLDDTDGDGRCNFDEYRAGTNPTNAADVLRLDCTRGGLRFEARPGKTYSIVGSQSANGPWTTIVNVPAPFVAHPVDLAWPTNGFFRLQTP